VTDEEWAERYGAFENWSFWNLFCISVALKVIEKGRTVSGRSFAVESNGIVSFFLLRLVSDI